MPGIDSAPLTFTINIDGRALSHDLLPLGIVGASRFLPRTQINQLTVSPGSGYSFQPGSGIVADFRFGVGDDGEIVFDPAFAAFASASGNTLTIRGQTIHIDARALSHDLLPIGISSDIGFLPRATVNQLTIIPARGYSFQPGSGIVADLTYGISRDGDVILAPEYAAFASASGNTLTIRGQTIHIDARALSHDLLPIGIASDIGFLRRATVNQLTIIPARGYSFQPGSGIVADLTYGISRDGDVILAPEYAAFASASGNTLTIRGQTIHIDARALSHDLLPIGIASDIGFLRRATVNQLTIIPARGYSFQPGSGIVADLTYGISRDGDVILAPEYAAFASASGNTLTIRGQTIHIDARALSHDLLPIGIASDIGFLRRATVNQLTIIPARGYSFQPGSGIVADLTYGISRDGDVILAPEYAAFASASGNTLTIRGQTIHIDARALSHDLLPIGIASDIGFLRRATVNQLTIIPARGYSFQPGSGIVADLTYGISRDGDVILAPEYAAFASASGNTLTIRGQTIHIDARALSHDLLPTGIASDIGFLPRRTVNPLTLIPASGYSFQPCAGIVADLSYRVLADGGVDFPDSCESFLAGRATNTLLIRGHHIVLSAARADSDLVGIANLGLRVQTPRELHAVLVPAKSYVPQTANGVFRTGFDLNRDGTITFDPAAGGSYAVRNSSSPNPSLVGEEIALTVHVALVQHAASQPQGSVTFRVGDAVLGTIPLEADGWATLRTALLPPGEHDIVADYPGDEEFEASSVTVRHRVEPRVRASRLEP